MNKINSTVIPSSAGDAYWQPGVQGNCITVKISPWNITNTNHTIFLHELPKDGIIPEHAHETNEEIFICLDGEGIVTIDGIDHAFKLHDVAYLAPQSKHTIRTTGDKTLKFMVIISPTGLEDRLKMMGNKKLKSTHPHPDSFCSELGQAESHGVILSSST